MQFASFHAPLKNLAAAVLMLAASACAAPGAGRRDAHEDMMTALERRIWPEPFPAAGRASLRPVLTAGIRLRTGTLGLNGIEGLDGEGLSRAVVLFPEDRARAGVITFEIEGGTDKGLHQCEALGRGATSLTPEPGWTPGTIREPDGRETLIYYSPKENPDGATQPGIYDLRNMRPEEYEIKFLNSDISGEEELAARLRGPDAQAKPFFTGVWKHWYPRDPEYSGLAPVDMVWSSRYQRFSQGADIPLFERPGVDKDPGQTARDPLYYTGPNGRYGTAVHTDRWDDRATALDAGKAARNEFRSFLFRDTSGCVKLRPDCLMLLNRFIDEQTAKGRSVQLEVRETALARPDAAQ